MQADERLTKRFHSRRASNAQFASLVNFSFHRRRFFEMWVRLWMPLSFQVAENIAKLNENPPPHTIETKVIHKCTKWIQNYIQLAIMVVGAYWDESGIYFIADAVNGKSCREWKWKELKLLSFERENWIYFSLESSVFEARGSVTVNSSVTNDFRLRNFGSRK